MVRSDLSDAMDGSAIDRVATELDADDVSHVARAVLDVASDDAVSACGREAATAAALRVADRRAGGADLHAAQVVEALDVEPGAVFHAEERLVDQLDDPAPDAVQRRLRRAIVGVREVLVAADKGRAVAPRLPGSIVDAEPALEAVSGRSLEGVDLQTLRVHLRRLEADLEVARLGVALHAALHDA